MPDGVTDLVIVDDFVAVCELVMLPVTVDDRDPLRVLDMVDEPLMVWLDDTDNVPVAVMVAVRVCVADTDPVMDVEDVMVPDGLAVVDDVRVAEKVEVDV